jgi:hypothetical protein
MLASVRLRPFDVSLEVEELCEDLADELDGDKIASLPADMQENASTLVSRESLLAALSAGALGVLLSIAACLPAGLLGCWVAGSLLLLTAAMRFGGDVQAAPKRRRTIRSGSRKPGLTMLLR